MNNSCSLKRIAVIGGLSDHQFDSKVRPLFLSDNVERIYLFRYNGNPVSVKHGKVVELVSGKLTPRRLHDIINLIWIFCLCLLRKVDVLVGIYLYPHGVFAGLLGRLFGIPVIQIMPGTDLAVYLETRRFDSILSSARAIGLRGERSLQQLADDGFPPKQLFVLNNVFELESHECCQKKVEKIYDLVTVGSLIERKRFDIFLRIVARLKVQWPHLRCLIVGDGLERRNLESLSFGLGLKQNVTFYGFSPRVLDLLHSSKIFVMTTRLEGLPMAMVEAMSCGLPVVVPRINDIPTLVKHGNNGFLVEDSEVDSYTKLCAELLADEMKRRKMGQRAAAVIEKLCAADYSFEAVASVWHRLLVELEPESLSQQNFRKIVSLPAGSSEL